MAISWKFTVMYRNNIKDALLFCGVVFLFALCVYFQYNFGNKTARYTLYFSMYEQFNYLYVYVFIISLYSTFQSNVNSNTYGSDNWGTLSKKTQDPKINGINIPNLMLNVSENFVNFNKTLSKINSVQGVNIRISLFPFSAKSYFSIKLYLCMTSDFSYSR